MIDPNEKHSIMYNIRHAKNPADQVGIEVETRFGVTVREVCELFGCKDIKEIKALFGIQRRHYVRSEEKNHPLGSIEAGERHAASSRKWYSENKEKVCARRKEKNALAKTRKSDKRKEPA